MTDISTAARSRILARLKAAPARAVPDLPEWSPPAYGAGRLARFTGMLEAAHAEIHGVTAEDWPVRLLEILGAKDVPSLVYAPATAHGRQLAEAWAVAAHPLTLIAYDRPVEELKHTLVHEAGAGLTTTLGGIAETGSLILWPTVDEPRLMSLLPPIHVALVEEARLFDSFTDAMRAEGWAARMPTNAVLVSGPSKTADIEQTLAYGVHGPKELIVLLVGTA
jgi:L-lactate dehydrogenase complex protein LldG